MAFTRIFTNLHKASKSFNINVFSSNKKLIFLKFWLDFRDYYIINFINAYCTFGMWSKLIFLCFSTINIFFRIYLKLKLFFISKIDEILSFLVIVLFLRYIWSFEYFPYKKFYYRLLNFQDFLWKGRNHQQVQINSYILYIYKNIKTLKKSLGSALIWYFLPTYLSKGSLILECKI